MWKMRKLALLLFTGILTLGLLVPSGYCGSSNSWGWPGMCHVVLDATPTIQIVGFIAITIMAVLGTVLLHMRKWILGK